jgi:hypothetical protein
MDQGRAAVEGVEEVCDRADALRVGHGHKPRAKGSDGSLYPRGGSGAGQLRGDE